MNYQTQLAAALFAAALVFATIGVQAQVTHPPLEPKPAAKPLTKVATKPAAAKTPAASAKVATTTAKTAAASAAVFFMTPRKPPYDAFAMTEKANLRDKPSTTTGKIVARLSVGQAFHVTELTHDTATIDGQRAVWVKATYTEVKGGKKKLHEGYLWSGLLSDAETVSRADPKTRFLVKNAAPHHLLVLALANGAPLAQITVDATFATLQNVRNAVLSKSNLEAGKFAECLIVEGTNPEGNHLEQLLVIEATHLTATRDLVSLDAPAKEGKPYTVAHFLLETDTEGRKGGIVEQTQTFGSYDGSSYRKTVSEMKVFKYENGTLIAD